ncbi:hypothetical protein DI53_3065 [Sphingobacterium deserti]|uniref:Uncharacterized protein n=1 Tax=Sphingobacterium deserti TaxID=1229276 RepID=A0A0B8T609_9SPHI|nr:hypothetical protein DI53_3065 [Sphingobacterium deserti]
MSETEPKVSKDVVVEGLCDSNLLPKMLYLATNHS